MLATPKTNISRTCDNDLWDLRKSVRARARKKTHSHHDRWAARSPEIAHPFLTRGNHLSSMNNKAIIKKIGDTAVSPISVAPTGIEPVFHA